MNNLKRIIYFLSSVYCAILLMLSLVIAVMSGTIIESRTGSHLYAMQKVYQHPLFTALLIFLFINILLSAVRRWPFQRRHIPFLMTHLGLLMMISGTCIKNYYGVQGDLFLWEGSSSQQLRLPHTEALWLEKKGEPPVLYPLVNHQLPLHFPMSVVSYTPHAEEKFISWIKEPYGSIHHLPPMSIQHWSSLEPTLQWVSSRFPNHEEGLIATIKTTEIDALLKYIFLEHATLHAQYKQISFSLPLKEACQKSWSIDHILCQTQFATTPTARLLVDWQAPSIERIELPLEGDQALHAHLITPTWKIKPSLSLTMTCTPTICIVQDTSTQTTWLFAMDRYGKIYRQDFSTLNNYFMYDKGYGGYGVQALFSAFGENPQTIVEDQNQHFIHQLNIALKQTSPMVPPLELLKKACIQARIDFAPFLVHFLYNWYEQGQALFSTTQLSDEMQVVFDHLDWDSVPTHLQKACILTSQLAQQSHYQNPLLFLEKNQWPLIDQLKQLLKNTPLWVALTQQLFAIAPQLPESYQVDRVLDASTKSHLFSAYLLAYGIDYAALCPPFTQHSSQELVLETTVLPSFESQPPSQKIEQNRPGIILKLPQQKTVALMYDTLGTGLKWPILNGTHLVRFQPHLFKLPYRVRLRQARQMDYPASNQVFSYESDVWIRREGDEPVEVTLSMNHVYETWDGYRFYLAGMSGKPAEMKQVQIVVNYDPAKYYLTYPGGCLVALGIFLLFWRKKY